MRCPCCDSPVIDRGAIADADIFAGRALVAPIPGGHLCDCLACELSFRWPVLEPSAYDVLYAAGCTASWDVIDDRNDHRIASRAIQRVCPEGGAVLDVGCGAGTLLNQLPARFQRFGIEIGSEARHRATLRGINLVGSTFDDLSTVDREFDLIVATDVIEHHAEPHRFLTDCLSRLRIGGHLILSTGDRSALFWRFLGPRFWYCQYAEHIVYLSPDWLRRICAGRYAVDTVERFRYADLGATRWLRQAAAFFLYCVAPTAYRRQQQRRDLRRADGRWSPPAPGAGLTKDHFLAVLRKT